MTGLIESKREVFFQDDFRSGLRNWDFEGTGRVFISKPGTMRLECVGSRQGHEGCHAFCRKDFPDGISVDFDLLVEKSDGLIIIFIAM